MANTKTKIIETSISLFNEHGYSNVSLHQIAKALGLSSGNLTYHFPKKESLMDAVYDTFTTELLGLQDNIGTQNKFDAIIAELNAFIKFQKRYLFFYVDLLDIGRNYPAIAKRHHKHIEGQITRIENNLHYNHAIGAMKPTDDATIRIVAETIWMTVVFWPSQEILRGSKLSNTRLTNSVISILKPYLKKADLNQINTKEKTYTT